MRPRLGILLLVSVVGLLLVGGALSSRLLRAGLSAAQRVTEERLRAIGITAVRALALATPEQRSALLDELTRDNQLEAAYLLEGGVAELRPVSRPGLPLLNLLRVDPDRVVRALAGEASVGPAYSLEALPSPEADAAPETILAGYFPCALPGPSRQILVLEAGTAFVAAPTQLRATAWATSVVAAALALLCVGLLLGSLRAAAREQRLRVQAERGQVLREMAAMVAHEVRNPLGTIRAAVELLREEGASSVLVTDVLSEVERLRGLTTDFLTLSQDPPLRLDRVDMAALCDETCERLRRQYPADALAVRRTGEASALVTGDADRLRQVLLNLAKNAVEAMQERGELDVRVSLRRDGVEVLVCDSGPGIDAQASRRLFQPFQTGKAAGTGLGLVISRRIAEQHGGALEWVPPDRRERGGPSGACFSLFLPTHPPRDATSGAGNDRGTSR